MPEDLCRSLSPMQGVADRVQLNSALSCGNPFELCSKTIAAGEQRETVGFLFDAPRLPLSCLPSFIGGSVH